MGILFTPGSIIGGKYRLEQPLSRGGMGSVWVAQHLTLDTRVAVKLMDPTYAGAATFVARFEREARSAASLRSPHVVNVADYGIDEGIPYLVMELLQGEDLGARLKRLRRLPLPEALRILTQAGRAIRRAHKAGLVHRDLKPSNLFLARVEDEEIVKILDFGIVKNTGRQISPDVTRTGEVLGSPRYMSPEQIAGDRGIDHRSDLWSIGVILFRALTGSLPFPGDQLGAILSRILLGDVPRATELAPDLPPALDDFFTRAFARDPADRFQSIDEMLDELRRIARDARRGIDDEETHDAPPSALPPSSLPASSRRSAQAPPGAVEDQQSQDAPSSPRLPGSSRRPAQPPPSALEDQEAQDAPPSARPPATLRTFPAPPAPPAPPVADDEQTRDAPLSARPPATLRTSPAPPAVEDEETHDAPLSARPPASGRTLAVPRAVENEETHDAPLSAPPASSSRAVGGHGPGPQAAPDAAAEPAPPRKRSRRGAALVVAGLLASAAIGVALGRYAPGRISSDATAATAATPGEQQAAGAPPTAPAPATTAPPVCPTVAAPSITPIAPAPAPAATPQPTPQRATSATSATSPAAPWTRSQRKVDPSEIQ